MARAEAETIISLKGNQGQLHQDTKEMFAYFEKIAFENITHTYHRQANGGHGRIEIRAAWVFSPHDHADYFRTLDEWATLQTVVMLRSERQLGGKVERETRYFISTLSDHARTQMAYIRQHWGIENKLHWVLDVAFRQDQQRARKANSAANFVSLRHMALNLLRLDKTKAGIETKRLKCAWDRDYRMQVLAPILDPSTVS